MATINEKLIEMEGRLQQIIDITESLKLSEDSEVTNKRLRLAARIERHVAENSKVSPEIRFQRYLYLGEERPLYQPGSRTVSKEKVPSLGDLVAEYEKKKAEKDGGEEECWLLSVISRAISDVNNPHPECAVFSLACLIRSSESSDALRSAAFAVARKVLLTQDQLFMFVKFATALHRTQQGKGSGGWGAGMRRLVTNWYLKQDVTQLAKSVSHQQGSHGWKHRDVIKMVHLKPTEKDVALSAVVMYALRGLEETEKKFGEVAEASAVMSEFRRRKLELQADSTELAKLVTEHKLGWRDFPTSKLCFKESCKAPGCMCIQDIVNVWIALLPNMPIRDIFSCLPQILKCRTDQEKVRAALAAALTREGAGATVQPAEVYVALKNYHKALVNKGHVFDSAYVIECRLKENFVVREPCTVTTTALQSLLTASFKAQETAGVRVLVAVDLREGPAHCQWTHSVTPLEAAALTSLCLARTNKRFTLTAFTEGQDLQIVSVPKSATVESIVDKFKEISAAKEPVMTEPLVWARERKRELDLFVVLTPSLKDWKWKGNDLGKALQSYRDTTKKPDAKLAICAFGNMSLHVATPKYPGILDLAGFHPDTIKVLNCFSQAAF